MRSLLLTRMMSQNSLIVSVVSLKRSRTSNRFTFDCQKVLTSSLNPVKALPTLVIPVTRVQLILSKSAHTGYPCTEFLTNLVFFLVARTCLLPEHSNVIPLLQAPQKTRRHQTKTSETAPETCMDEVR